MEFALLLALGIAASSYGCAVSYLFKPLPMDAMKTDPPFRSPEPDGMYQASFNALVMAERLKAQKVEGYWDAYAARPRTGEMIVLGPGMRLTTLATNEMRDALAESIRQRMDVEHNPICEPGTIAFELGAQVSVLQPDGRKVFYSCDEIPAAIESSRRMKTLVARDNRAARATFFPKAKNRKCVG